MKVFLGGTCNGSTWRDSLISKLNIDYFNPVVDDWNEEAQKNELRERKECDFVLYTITPKMKGFYSIAEVVDDSNKRPHSTIFCVLPIETEVFESDERRGHIYITKAVEVLRFDEQQTHSLNAVKNLVKSNGAQVFDDLDDVANYLNQYKEPN